MTMIDTSLPYYHIIDLPDGSTTPGRVDRRQEHQYVGVGADDSLKGARVLDIGALDGVLSFMSERKGAAHVKAIDVDDMELYDWGHRGPPDSMRGRGPIKNQVFLHLREVLQSKVEREQKTVYDLKEQDDGRFDLVFFYGVLYHLRHPLLAFDRIRGVCSGAIVVETHVCNVDPQLPSSLFYIDDVLRGAVTNWTGPSEACVLHWMKDAGFQRVFAEKKQRMKSRQRFIGLVDETSPFDGFPNTSNFFEADAAYFEASRRAVEHALAIGSFKTNPWMPPDSKG